MCTTKDAFLHEFLDFRFSPDQIPADWMAEAWEVDGIRDYLASDISRMISKTGEIHYEAAFGELLSRSLTCEQVVWLYEWIREDARRHEDEWRAGFGRMFARCAAALPAPLLDPYHDWHLEGRDFPWEWMEHAWADQRIREGVVRGMARDLDHHDDAWCGPEWLDLLDRSLDRVQIVQLYYDLRIQAKRPESQWRWVFEDAFPDCAKYLPVLSDGSSNFQ